MRNQTATNTYDPSVDMNFNEEGEFVDSMDNVDSTIIPTEPANNKSRRLIEQRAEELRLKKELDYLDGFSFDDGLQ